MKNIIINQLDLIDISDKQCEDMSTSPYVVRVFSNLDCIAECHFETTAQVFAFLRTTPEGKIAVIFDTHFNKKAVYMLS